MKEPWKIGVGLLALALLILMCPFLAQLMSGSDVNWSGYLELSADKIHFWVEREGEQPEQTIEDGDLSFQINDYFWTTDQIHYFNIADLRNTGRRERETLIVDFTVTNQFNRRLPLAFCYVLDVNDQQFEAVISNAIPFDESFFAGATIEPEESLRVKLAFAVPEGHLPLWIRCAECNAIAKIE